MSENDQIINQLISNIKLSKKQERDIYGKEYISLFQDGSYYSSMYKDTVDSLRTLRENYQSNKKFYENVAKNTTKEFVPLLISEYNVKDEEKLLLLENIGNGNNIKVFDIGEAKNFVEQNGESLNGDCGAFKFHEFICFTPDIDSGTNSISKEESISNAAKMLGSMIHETMHMLIDVTKQERFEASEVSQLTSGGTILNEGLVEMHTTDFALKYGLCHNPAMYYFNNVSLCRYLEKTLGEDEFRKVSFYGDYEEMISCLSDEQIKQYKLNERIRYFERRQIVVNPEDINLETSLKKIWQQLIPSILSNAKRIVQTRKVTEDDVEKLYWNSSRESGFFIKNICEF